MPQPATPPNAPTSTIVQLLYAVPPRLVFAGLIEQLGRVMPGGGGASRRLALAGPDTAHLDLPGARLTLSLRRDINRAIGACLTIGIGPRPARPAAGKRQGPPAEQVAEQVADQTADQTALARRIADAISARFAPNQTIWHITPAVVSRAVIEDLHAALPQTLPRAEDSQDSVDMSRVIARIEATLRGKDSIDAAPLDRQDMQRHAAQTQGFSARFGKGQFGFGPGPSHPGPRRAPQQRAQPAPAPANAGPHLPRPDLNGQQRTLHALTRGGGQTALTLRLRGVTHQASLG